MGFITHMAKTIQYNRDLLKEKVSLKDLRGSYHSAYKNTGDPEGIGKVLMRRQMTRNRDRLKNQFLFVAFFGLIILSLYFILSVL